MIAGKSPWCVVTVMGKGLGALPLPGATVLVTEIDPICAPQAAMEGYRVVTMDGRGAGRYFVTATGNVNVITHAHMLAMKDQSIVQAYIGHLTAKSTWLACAVHLGNIKPQVDHIIFPDGKRIILVAEGFMNLIAPPVTRRS